MEEYKKNLAELISNLVFEYKDYPSPLKVGPSKQTLCHEEAPTMRRIQPERCGISSLMICELLHRLEREDYANVHSILMAHSERVIAEASRPGYTTRTPHLAHSMTKSVTGIMIMQLIDDSKFDTGTHICDFFPEIKPRSRLFSSLTVEHLLTMSSGIVFGEVGVVCDTSWTKTYFESDLAFLPGEKFAYNSMNSYILAVIADRICKSEYGVGAEDFVYERLFAPLGIKKPLWEHSTEGIIKGGFGLYLSCESWVKIGSTILNGGVWQGKRILSERSVNEATSPRMKTNAGVGDFDYGYHVWVSPDKRDVLFNGMFGQNVLINRESGIITAITAGNNELFSKSETLSAIREQLGKNVTRVGFYPSKKELATSCDDFFLSRRWIIPKEEPRGLPYILGLKKRAPIPPQLEGLVGEYTFPKNNQGLMPVFVRAMQSNFYGGIKAFRFEIHNGQLRLISREGGGDIAINLGIYGNIDNTVEMGGEVYSVSALAGASEDSSGEITYKIELLFPELPNTRRITMTLSPLGRLNVRMNEMPDERITDSFVDAIPTLSGKLGLLYRLLERSLGKNFVESKLRDLFSPSFTAISVKAPDYDAALAEENEKIDEKILSSRLVRSLVFNFLGNEEKVADLGGGALGMLAGFLGKFF